MATIQHIVAQIRTAIYGKDVRENIAQGIEKCYSDVSAGVTEADAAASRATAAAVRGETINSELGDNADDLVIVNQNQPSLSKEFNKIWIKPDGTEYQVPTWEEFSDVKSAFVNDTNAITGNKPYIFEEGFYYKTTNDPLQNGERDSASGYAGVKIPCSYGDVFTVYAHADKSGSSRTIAFYNASNELIYRSYEDTAQNGEVTAPENTAYMVVNNRQSYLANGYYVYKGTGIIQKLAGKQDTLVYDSFPKPDSNNPVKSEGIFTEIEQIRTAIGTYDYDVSGSYVGGSYWNDQDDTAVLTTYATYRYYPPIAVNPGERYKVSGWFASSTKQHMALVVDSSYKILARYGYMVSIRRQRQNTASRIE